MAESGICVPFFLSCYPQKSGGTRAARSTKWSKARPQGLCWGTGHVTPPPTEPDSPHASNRPTAPRSGGPQPLGRSGQLGTMPPDAPVASTPPRRREPGR